jgi:hypothetical protein
MTHPHSNSEQLPSEPSATVESSYATALQNEVQQLPSANLSDQDPQSLVWGIGIALACAFALGQPLIDYFEPVQSTAIGILTGSAVLSLHAIWMRKGWCRYAFLTISLASIIAAAVFLFGQALEATRQSRANDDRCNAIQTDMLRADPARSDGPALFQALKCSPSGTEAVNFPAS